MFGIKKPNDDPAPRKEKEPKPQAKKQSNLTRKVPSKFVDGGAGGLAGLDSGMSEYARDYWQGRR